jgi:hypothetical protein
MRNHAGPGRARGAPGAWKQARRVREAAWGNGSADKAGTAPRADFTTHVSGIMTDLIAAGQLTALVKTRLRRMQYRGGLLEGFLTGTRLDLTPFCNPRN